MIFSFIVAVFFFWIINFGSMGTQAMALIGLIFTLRYLSSLLNRSFCYSSSVLIAWLFLMIIFLPGMIMGLIHNNLGFTEMMLFFVVSVTLHFFPFRIGNINWYDSIIAIVIASLLLNIFFHAAVLFDLFTGANYLSNTAVFKALLEIGFAYGVDNGFEIQLPNYSLSIFAAAYFNSLLVLRYISATLKAYQLLFFLLVDLYIYLIGSRSLYLVVVFALLLPVLYRGRIFKFGSFFKSRILSMQVLSLLIFGFVTLYIAGTITHGLADSTESDLVRVEQSDYLISNIFESPLFGKGFGYVGDYIRSQNHPWAFELSYLVLTLWVGLPSVFLFFIYMLLHYFYSMRHAYDFELSIKLYSAIVASFNIFIASAFNPYLYNFSSLWVVFIPFWYRFWLHSKLIPSSINRDGSF